MKKRVVALVLALLFVVTGIVSGNENVYAEETAQNVELSEIWDENALIGYGQSQTWGVYLSQGISIINDAGGGKIGCGGITNAAKRCKVSVNAIVEKKVNGSWTRVTSWSATDTNALTVSISKTLSVASGYYYRVRSNHTAGTDGSSSYTSAMWM